jgi:hypothetical protein
VAALLAGFFSAAAFADSFAIVSHEVLGNLAPGNPAAAFEKPSASPGTELSFVAFGARFDFVLTRNDRLIANLGADDRAALAGIELLEGKLAGNDASWARLVRSANRVAGLVWDGSEIYSIGPAADVARHLAGPPADPGSLIIYRGSDVRGSFGDVLSEWHAATTATAALLTEFASQSSPIFDPAKQIDVGIVGDYEFVHADPATANARLLEIMSNVDAIFARNLGVYINVAAIELFPSEPDPFTTSTPQGLLQSLQNYKETTATLRDKGLAHLFTYRDIEEPPSSTNNTIGAAVRGSVCDVRTSVGVTQANFGALVNSLITAHEIGHNFGAPHDGEGGSVCAATPATFLMAPNVNYSSELSACSIEQMRPLLLGAVCLNDMPVADVSVTKASQSPNPVDVPLGGQGTLQARIASNGPTDALAVDIDVAASGIDLVRLQLIKQNAFTDTFEYTCSVAERRCHIPRFPAGKAVTVVAETAFPSLGAATLTFSARGANDANSANDFYQYALNVTPAVDVELLNGKLAPPKLRPLDVSLLTFDLINRSTIAATNTVVTVHFTNDLEIVNAASRGCTLLPSGLWSCAVGTIASLETKRVSIEFRARATATFNQVVFLSWASTERYLDPGSTAFAVDIVQKLADVSLVMTLPTLVAPGAGVDLVAKIENVGPDVAEGLEFVYSNNEGIRIESITASHGTCMSLGSWAVRCNVPALGLRQPVTVTMAGIASTNIRGYLQTAGITTTTPDPYADDNLVSNRFEVSNAPPPTPQPSQPQPPSGSGGSTSTGGGGGGGGGAMDPLLLLACLSILLRRQATSAGRRTQRAKPRQAE